MLRAGARIPPGIVGSSPLTRGKPRDPRRSCGRRRLIPAHAGKTTTNSVATWWTRAHPRSRGENMRSSTVRSSKRGSSPLTRGKPHPMARRTAGGRLIPAHAGKTQVRRTGQFPVPAHPRSRGENARAASADDVHGGSSPLTRGKPDPRLEVGDLIRLIPAHAGKTTNARGDKIAGAAHPRSRGEKAPTR